MKTQVISFHCVLRNSLGQLLSSSYNSEVLADGEESVHLPKDVARSIQGLRKGERKQIFLPAERAFGPYYDDLLIEVPLSKLKPFGTIRVGAEVIAQTGDGEPRVFRVVEVTETRALVDGNHPLAGQDLIFDLEATDVREATEAEIQSIAPPSSAKAAPMLH